MKTDKLGALLPTQSLVLLLLCGAGVIVFLVLIIFPGQRLSAELDQDIVGLRARIEEQKILSPVFKTIFAKTKATAPQALPAPARTKLTRAEISTLPKRLKETADANRLTVREIVPEVNTLTDASGRFLMRVNAFGQFRDLRGFLVAVGALPFFESIEGIEIRAVEGGEEFAMKIWLARE